MWWMVQPLMLKAARPVKAHNHDDHWQLECKAQMEQLTLYLNTLACSTLAPDNSFDSHTTVTDFCQCIVAYSSLVAIEVVAIIGLSLYEILLTR
jgi:hypothetical protein